MRGELLLRLLGDLLVQVVHALVDGLALRQARARLLVLVLAGEELQAWARCVTGRVCAASAGVRAVRQRAQFFTRSWRNFMSLRGLYVGSVACAAQRGVRSASAGAISAAAQRGVRSACSTAYLEVLIEAFIPYQPPGGVQLGGERRPRLGADLRHGRRRGGRRWRRKLRRRT